MFVQRLLQSLLLLMVFGVAGLRVSQAQPASADADSVKAAYLVNFMRYTNWPAASLGPGQTMTLCVLDANVLGGKLAELQGKSVNGRLIEVRVGSDANSLKPCEMLFVGAAQGKRLAELVRQLKGLAVLLVSDVADAARNGAAIELLESEDRIRMIVNRQNAEQAGLSFSAQLLRLALAVY